MYGRPLYAVLVLQFDAGGRLLRLSDRVAEVPSPAGDAHASDDSRWADRYLRGRRPAAQSCAIRDRGSRRPSSAGVEGHRGPRGGHASMGQRGGGCAGGSPRGRVLWHLQFGICALWLRMRRGMSRPRDGRPRYHAVDGPVTNYDVRHFARAGADRCSSSEDAAAHRAIRTGIGRVVISRAWPVARERGAGGVPNLRWIACRGKAAVQGRGSGDQPCLLLVRNIHPCDPGFTTCG